MTKQNIHTIITLNLFWCYVKNEMTLMGLSNQLWAISSVYH
jgi:hypothetical protein